MNTDIYYFSGTGNSLWIAKKIKEQLANSKLISIPQVINQEEIIEGNIIGIVCPIYMFNVPPIVAKFITKIEKAKYVFLVFAGGGVLGNGIQQTLKNFRTDKLKPSAIFNIPMPGNYAPYGSTPEETQNKLFADIDRKVKNIISVVESRGNYIDNTNTTFFQTHIHPGLLYRLGYINIPKMDRQFVVTDKCTGCSICQKVCPVDNITIVNNKPLWNNHCQQCYACLQWCPQEAIQAGGKTVGVKRYHNPNVTVKDICQCNCSN